jgi:hypothetical protein
LSAGYIEVPSSADEKITEMIDEAQMGEVINNIFFGSKEPRILDWAEGRPVDFALEEKIDEKRKAYGLAPRYGYRGKPGVLGPGDGGRLPAAITPKIYSGGGGSNHDSPTAGAATIQRVRETAAAERRHREVLIQAR